MVIGNIVSHVRFGKGEVLKLEGKGNDIRAEINFENGGVKKLHLPDRHVISQCQSLSLKN